jgi:hypothetical protein
MRPLVASLGLGLLALSAVAAEGWIRFRDPVGNFTVEFQGLPRATSQVGVSLIGENVQITTYFVQDSFGTMMVVDAPVFNRTSASSEQLLEMAAKRVLANAASTGGMVQSNMQDMLDGQLGRRFSILGRDGSLQTSRVFYFNEHIYQLIAITVGATRARVGEAAHFSQSLRLTARRPR